MPMSMRFSRRRMMQGVGGAALARSVPALEAAPGGRSWPIGEGPDTPKLCLAAGDGGGPLPASLQPAAQEPQAGGRGGRGGGRGPGYGGYLPPAEEAPANAAYQRIRQPGG